MRFNPSEFSYGEGEVPVAPAAAPTETVVLQDDTSKYIQWGKAALGWDKDILQKYGLAQANLESAKQAYKALPNFVTKLAKQRAQANVDALRPLARDARIAAIGKTAAWLALGAVGVSGAVYFGAKAFGEVRKQARG